MGKLAGSVLVLFVVVLVMLTSVVTATSHGAVSSSSATICNVEMTDLLQCFPAISGSSPPSPTAACCKVVHKVNMKCLCKYKPQLAKFGANPAAAMALPKKCGLKPPPVC